MGIRIQLFGIHGIHEGSGQVYRVRVVEKNAGLSRVKKGKLRFYVGLVTDELDIQKPRINVSRGGNCWG